ncbi:MAG: hypothetical protein ABIQ49_07530 [Gemmatimonadales bacterium]
MTALLAACIGLLAGVHAATWGMYKDAPHEGFSRWKYARSPLLGAVLAPLVAAAARLDPRHAGDLVLLFGVTYVLERALAEIYKTFLREEDQGKYFIPMQLHVLGTVVQSRAVRLTAGLLYAAGLVGMLLVVDGFDRSSRGPHTFLLVVLVGGVGGWISAFGGAWKDAPSEGFQTFKFFRSPALASLFAAGLAGLTPILMLVTLAATGYTIATTETYKTFFFPSRPRGKFAGMPIRFPEMLRRRQRFVPLYVAIWAGVLAAIAGATHG